MNDKTKELSATVKLLNDKLHFEGLVEGNKPVSIDYIPPLGDDLGYTSLELLLLSLSSCLGSALLTFLRCMNKQIMSFEIHSKGFRNQSHPTSFSEIIMEIVIQSVDVKEEEIVKLVQMAEEKYCPVWAMIKGNVEVQVKTIIER